MMDSSIRIRLGIDWLFFIKRLLNQECCMITPERTMGYRFILLIDCDCFDLWIDLLQSKIIAIDAPWCLYDR